MTSPTHTNRILFLVISLTLTHVLLMFLVKNINKRMLSSMSDKIKSRLEAISPLHSEIQDTSGGCGQSFNVMVVSEEFKGKSVLQRHRLINDLLKDEISSMHAFSQKCLTPEQWNELK
jgi:stress-induced morphogen